MNEPYLSDPDVTLYHGDALPTLRCDPDDDGPVYDRPTINVYPLKENKRPVGFAREWPKQKPKKKRPPRPKAKK